MSQNSLPLTKTRVESLAPPKCGRIFYRDTKQPGFTCCVTSTGLKTYYVYKRIGPRVVKYRLGRVGELTPDQARRMATEKIAEFMSGKPMVRRSKSGAPTFSQAFAAFIEDAKRRKKSWPEDQRKYDRHLARRWGSKPLVDITKTDVAKLHNTIHDKHGLYAANRLLSLVKSIFNNAIHDEDFRFEGPSPAARVQKFREESRERFLQPDELPRFLKALSKAPPDYRDFFLLCLLTGQRRGNVAGMQWGDVDLRLSIWRIPKTKQHKSHTVPLAEPAVQLLLTRLDNDSEWVFPATDNSTGHMTEFRKPWLKILKDSELSDLRIHDLRRTLGSYMAIQGNSELIIGKVLGHAEGSRATAVYARLSDQSLRVGMDQAFVAMGLGGQNDEG